MPNPKKKFKKSYDACLLSYSPNPFNLNATWDRQIITELQVFKVFNDLGFKNILIKLKNYTHSNVRGIVIAKKIVSFPYKYLIT